MSLGPIQDIQTITFFFHGEDLTCVCWGPFGTHMTTTAKLCCSAPSEELKIHRTPSPRVLRRKLTETDRGRVDERYLQSATSSSAITGMTVASRKHSRTSWHQECPSTRMSRVCVMLERAPSQKKSCTSNCGETLLCSKVWQLEGGTKSNKSLTEKPECYSWAPKRKSRQRASVIVRTTNPVC